MDKKFPLSGNLDATTRETARGWRDPRDARIGKVILFAGRSWRRVSWFFVSQPGMIRE
jgi:hypothetical protein